MRARLKYFVDKMLQFPHFIEATPLTIEQRHQHQSANNIFLFDWTPCSACGANLNIVRETSFLFNRFLIFKRLATPITSFFSSCRPSVCICVSVLFVVVVRAVIVVTVLIDSEQISIHIYV